MSPEAIEILDEMVEILEKEEKMEKIGKAIDLEYQEKILNSPL